MDDLVAYLRSKGLTVKPGPGYEVVVECWICDDSKAPRLYINTLEGLWHCKRCDTAGNLRTLYREFGDEYEAPDLGDPMARQRVLEDAVSFAQECLTQNMDALIYLLEERGLDENTILERRLGWLPRQWSLRDHLLGKGHQLKDIKSANLLYPDGGDFFAERLLIPYLHNGRVVQIRGKQLDGKYFTGINDSVRLFNADVLIGHTGDVIVCEGEMDCMILSQTLASSTDPRLRDVVVVGLAGVSAAPPNFPAYFESVRRCYLGLDPDAAGDKATAKLRAEIPTARVIELPRDLPKCDWTEAITRRGMRAADIRGLMDDAAGGRLHSIAQALRLLDQVGNDVQGLALGFASLDKTIAPGITPGQIIIPLAKTGVGKTLIGVNVAYNIVTSGQGGALYISLEMTTPEIMSRLRKISRFYHPHASHADIIGLLDGLMICDENRLGERDFRVLVDEYEAERGFRPALVVVDYLGYYARGFRGASPYEKASNAAMQLKADAKAEALAIFAPSQVNRSAEDGKPIASDKGRDSGVLEETADFVIPIWRPDNAMRVDADMRNLPPNGKFIAELAKVRRSGQGKRFTWQMALESLVLVEDGTPEARRAQLENQMVNDGARYEDVLYSAQHDHKYITLDLGDK